MKRILIQALVTAVVFVGLWQGLRCINWMSLFAVQDNTVRLEEKLGDLSWKMISQTEDVNNNRAVMENIDTLLQVLCEKNNIDHKTLSLHIINKDEVNAFALPNKHLVVYTGLLKECTNQSELCGVLAHELAHIEKRHIMDKLVKELGLSALISLGTGGGSGATRQLVKLLSSTAYDRKLETEADLAAVDYLIAASIDPKPFADFLYRLGNATDGLPNQLYWISTHPESKARAEEIIAAAKHKTLTPKDILSADKWETVHTVE